MIFFHLINSVFAFDNLKYDGIQIGDKAFYILKECDVNNPSSKSLSDEQAAYHKEQADHKRSKQSGKGKEVPIDEAVSPAICCIIFLYSMHCG